MAPASELAARRGSVTGPAMLQRARRSVLTVFFLNGFGLAQWFVRIPDVKTRLSLSEGTLGVVLLALAAGSLMAMPFVGRLAARYGSKPVVVALAVLFPASLVLPHLAPSVSLLAVALIVLGAANGGLDVAMNVHAATVERCYARPIMSSFHATWSVGALSGAALAGLLAEVDLSPLHHALVVLPPLLGLAVLSAPSLLPRAADAAQPRVARESVRPTGRLILIALLGTCATVTEGGVADWSALYLRDVLGASAGIAAAGFGAFQLAMTVIRFAGDGFAARFGAGRLLRVSGILAACGMALAILAPHPAWSVVGFCIVGAGTAVVFPSMISAAGRLPGISSGGAIAFVTSIAYTGFLAGPPLIGGMAEVVGLRGAIGVMALAALAVAALGSVADAQRGR